MTFKFPWGLLLAVWMAGSAQAAPRADLIVFYAPVFAPVMDALRPGLERDLRVALRTEIKGSQMLCRQVSELGRECDLMLLADAELFKTLLPGRVRWRLEFAHDEMVLGVGRRAPRADEAERNWTRVLLDPAVSLGRVQENLAPVGYRTLLVWALEEKRGHPGLAAALKNKTTRLWDHAENLAAALQNGDADYGFLYKTACLQYNLRFIPLAPEINLGREGGAYGRVRVSYAKPGASAPLTVTGSTITLGLSIPDSAPHRAQALEALRYLLHRHQRVFVEKGFAFYKPKFFGTRRDFQPLQGVADYAGDF